MGVSATPLEEVERAAFERAEAEDALRMAIRKAHATGASFRKIAEAAGMSHEQVRRVASR